MSEDAQECCEESMDDAPRPMMNPRAGIGEPVPVNPSHAADARIRAVENGFIVEVGCKTFVCQDWEEIAEALGEYWKNPIKAEKKFSKKR